MNYQRLKTESMLVIMGFQLAIATAQWTSSRRMKSPRHSRSRTRCGRLLARLLSHGIAISCARRKNTRTIASSSIRPPMPRPSRLVRTWPVGVMGSWLRGCGSPSTGMQLPTRMLMPAAAATSQQWFGRALNISVAGSAETTLVAMVACMFASTRLRRQILATQRPLPRMCQSSRGPRRSTSMPASTPTRRRKCSSHFRVGASRSATSSSASTPPGSQLRGFGPTVRGHAAQ
mmetsp:Transcript_7371/g.18506  ORF Transcript_7371/g.18506 Transcript_7371/m.18506 type:complete len:232 (-) Transcript_7371:277-972(-)